MNNFLQFIPQLLSVIFLVGILSVNNIGLFAEEKTSSGQAAMTADKISAEIAPFVDDDTVFVCYVDCVTANSLHKLSAICTNLIEADNNTVGLRVKNVLKQVDDYWRHVESKQQKGNFSQLLESNINHFYFVYNLKYLHLGAFYVVPSVGEDKEKITVVEKFFGVQNDENTSTWSLTKDDYLIIGGKNIVLRYITGWFRYQEGLGSIYSFASIMTDDFRYVTGGMSSAGKVSNIEHRKKLFKNYPSKNTPELQNALNELEDSNAIKIIIFNTDTSAANEFLWCKNMKAPLNQTSLDFVCTSRKYIVLGVNTELPCIKICIQTDSKKKSESFRQYLTTIIREVGNNYFELPAFIGQDYEEKIVDKEEWTRFLMLLFPEIKNDKLEVNINDKFFHKISHK
jgi:nicotinamide riboside kinase